MTENSSPENTPVTLTVDVTVLERRVVTIDVARALFTERYGPTARANLPTRVDSLMESWVERHRADFPDIPVDAVIDRVDVRR